MTPDPMDLDLGDIPKSTILGPSRRDLRQVMTGRDHYDHKGYLDLKILGPWMIST